MSDEDGNDGGNVTGAADAAAGVDEINADVDGGNAATVAEEGKVSP